MSETLFDFLRLLGVIACFAAPAYIMFKYPDDPEW
tara:strand:- start:522 stop:626 length:105 start_codon:yes stop_codon:yes gene_type:complete